jgi:hypothetical protein
MQHLQRFESCCWNAVFTYVRLGPLTSQVNEPDTWLCFRREWSQSTLRLSARVAQEDLITPQERPCNGGNLLFIVLFRQLVFGFRCQEMDDLTVAGSVKNDSRHSWTGSAPYFTRH